MGTSSARRGPGTAAWRWAKGAASRYMAADETTITAQELVSRYVAALEETGRAGGQGLLSAFRLTRRVAQNLGALAEKAGTVGLPAALADLGLSPLATVPPEAAAPCLVSLWLPGEAGLEAAVLPTALACSLKRLFPDGPHPPDPVASAALVQEFLALALSHRLIFDLGESLEGAATSGEAYQKKMLHLEETLKLKARSVSLPGPEVGEWQGLPGWLWVTRVLETLIQQLKEAANQADL